MVFALAGDSTMTRLSAIKKSSANASGLSMRLGFEARRSSMLRAGLLLAGLARQHHQHHPLEPARCRLRRASSASRRSMTISRCSGERMPSLLELQQIAAAARSKPRQLASENMRTRRADDDARARRARQRDPPASRARARRLAAEAGAFQIARQSLAFGHFRAARPACTGRKRKSECRERFRSCCRRLRWLHCPAMRL